MFLHVIKWKTYLRVFEFVGGLECNKMFVIYLYESELFLWQMKKSSL